MKNILLNFIVSSFTFRSLTHFEFILAYDVRESSNSIHLHIVLQFSLYYLLKTFLLPVYIHSFCHRLGVYRCMGSSLDLLFYPFNAVLNGIAFMPSFSDSSLRVYRKATDSGILMLCLATLLNTFISSNSTLLDILRFSKYSIMLSANRQFYFFLSNLDVVHFFFLSDSCGKDFQYHVKWNWQEWSILVLFLILAAFHH